MRSESKKYITAELPVKKQLCFNLHNEKIDMMDVNCRKTKYWSVSILSLLRCVFVCVFIISSLLSVYHTETDMQTC